MLAAILPIILPALIQVIAYAFQKKILNDSQRQAFLDFVQAMSNDANNSKMAHDKFKKMHEDLKNKV